MLPLCSLSLSPLALLPSHIVQEALRLTLGHWWMAQAIRRSKEGRLTRSAKTGLPRTVLDSDHPPIPVARRVFWGAGFNHHRLSSAMPNGMELANEVSTKRTRRIFPRKKDRHAKPFFQVEQLYICQGCQRSTCVKTLGHGEKHIPFSNKIPSLKQSWKWNMDEHGPLEEYSFSSTTRGVEDPVNHGSLLRLLV